MNELSSLIRSALQWVAAWRDANRVVFNIAAAALGLTAVLAAAFYVINPGAPVVIASNLSAADRTALALRLRRHRIDFTVGADSITVPSSQASEAGRILALSPGFAGGIEDFSLFDRATMGQSDFAEQVNYQRSIQGELERTIMNIHGVDSARVMVALGHPSPFALGPAEAERASVMLTTSPGAVIDAAMARAIAHLVAGSVHGLAAENVSVASNDGTILYPPAHEGEMGDAIRLRDDFEHRIQEKLSSLLGRIMGTNRFAVEVSVDVDTSRVASRDQMYGKGDTTIISEEHSVTPSSIASGGIPGLGSNLPVPSPQPTPQPTPAPGAAVPDHSTEKQTATAEAARKDIVNYQPSIRETTTVTAPVRIKRITVAAVLDGTYDGGAFKPLPKDRIDAIRSLVSATIGLDASRGDSVDVQSAALSQPYVPPVPNPMTQLREFIGNPIHLYEAAGAALFVLILLLWAAKRIFSRIFSRKHAAAGAEKTVSPAMSPSEAPAPAATTPSPAAIDRPAANEYEIVRARINQAADKDPEAIARALRKLLEAASTDGAAADTNGAAH
jgi:flagellar M-ring protein FliF